MTGFDISQLCAHYGIHELELLSFSVVEMEFAAPNLPDKMGPEASRDGMFLITFTLVSREVISILQGIIRNLQMLLNL